MWRGWIIYFVVIVVHYDYRLRAFVLYIYFWSNYCFRFILPPLRKYISLSNSVATSFNFLPLSYTFVKLLIAVFSVAYNNITGLLPDELSAWINSSK